MIDRRAAVLLATLALLVWPRGLPAAEPTPALVARGKYVFGAAGGCACHTTPDGAGLNAGGTKFDMSFFGIVYTPNITPDAETGIGKWTDAQIVNAIRRGERPDGARLFPIHPYKYLSNIADDEIEALVAYLKSVKPVKSSVPLRSLKIPVPTRTIVAAPKIAPREGLARGEYLAGARDIAPSATRPAGSMRPRTIRSSWPAAPGRSEAWRPTSRRTSRRGSGAGPRLRSRGFYEPA